MNSLKQISILVCLIGSCMLFQQLKGQETPADLRDLVGVRASSGEADLTSRNYVLKKAETTDDSKYQYWYNTKKNQCITVRVFDGKYSSIVETPNSDCGVSSEEGGGGVKNGYADLVGARASSGEGELESRGYKLKKTESAGDSKYQYWWNASKKECITVRVAEGRYSAITKTMNADCSQ